MANVIKKYLKSFKSITNYYYFLVDKTKNHEYVEITNEWLIDNYYLLVEHNNSVKNIVKKLSRDNRVVNKMYTIVKNIVNKKNYAISFPYLVEEMKRYQRETKKTFTYKELEYILPILTIIYTEKLNELCHDEYIKLVDKEDVEKIVREKSNLTLDSFIGPNFDLKNNFHYIFEINNQLSKIDNNNYIFKELNEYLKDNQVILKDIINEEFQNKIKNNVLVSNIFTDLANFMEISIEEIFEKISKTEKKLLQDPTYKLMTLETKRLYRKQLVKAAKKHHLNEYDYLEKIFDINEHIGYKLFKKEKTTFRFSLYILSILVITALICFFLSKIFIGIRVLGFIILLIPVSQIVIQVVNHFLTRVVPSKVIPKLDYLLS